MILKKPLLEYFPEGFTPRPHQIKGFNAIDAALREGKKFIIIEAPTGSGKSFISKTLANITNDCDSEFKSLVFNYYAYDEDYVDRMALFPPHGLAALTTTKVLQNQYKGLFNEATVFKGKSNYQCDVEETLTCNIAPCVITQKLKKECWEEHRCPYYEARNSAIIDRFAVLNYSSFFNLPKHLRHRQIIVCDEASELEGEIVKKHSTNIDYTLLTKLDIKFSKLLTDKPSEARAWLEDLTEALEEAINSRANRSRYDNNKSELRNQQIRKDILESIITTKNHWDVTEYIIEKDAARASFTPLKVDKLSDCLFDYADTVILMSATIVNKNIFAKTLGIEDYTFIEFESTFDPKKSKIRIDRRYPLSKATMEKNLPKVLETVASIVESYKGKKGIIHTHTNVITAALQKVLKGKRFLFREDAEVNDKIVAEHMLRPDDTVLVSPSLTMGLDLKGDLGTWQIVMKLPWMDLGNKRVQRLSKEMPEWYTMKMLITLIQACGRCTRCETDVSDTYILDGGAWKAVVENKDILPKHFLDRLV